MALKMFRFQYLNFSQNVSARYSTKNSSTLKNPTLGEYKNVCSLKNAWEEVFRSK